MASCGCYDNSDVIATLIITHFHLYLIQLWWQFFQMFVYGVVAYAQKKLHRYWPWKTVSSHFHVLVRPMLLHRMALVSVRRFCKNLGNLQEFFGQTVYRPPPPDKKLPVRLCKDGKGRQFDSRKKSHCMASRSRKINQMQCTFLQNKYVTEVGPWKVAPCTDTMNKEE